MKRPRRPRSAVVAVGTELVTGHRADTNGEEVSRALAAAGFHVQTREVLADDIALLADRLKALCSTYELVVVTGGLGPTHDDVTREGAARALGVELVRDPTLEPRLAEAAKSHRDSRARSQVLRQADVLAGATVIEPVVGTAPGQLAHTDRGHLLLLPGPPRELRPMLSAALRCLASNASAEPRTVGCVDVRESDVQLVATRILADYDGIGLTVLARPSLVDVVLFDNGAGEAALEQAAAAIADALGDAVYATDGSTLAETVIGLAIARTHYIGCAESCTGGMIASSLTAVPGASAAFLGSVVAYADRMKESVLGVSAKTLTSDGAVSSGVASEMALGARVATGADIAIAVSGIAGPSGGTPDKPVGTVWFALAAADGVTVTHRLFTGDRQAVRERATAVGLDLLRRALLTESPYRA